MHAGEVDAGDRRHQRLRARGDHEALEAQLVGVVEPEHAALGVDPGDRAADEQVDVVVGEPLGGTQRERLRVLPRDEDLRQPDAIVRCAALAADERDGDVAIALAERLADGLAGDSSADDDDPPVHVSTMVGQAGFLGVPGVFPGDERGGWHAVPLQ